MSDLIRRLATLPSDKQRLLLLMLQRQGTQLSVGPLSFSQQRFWFLYNLEPDSPAYNIPSAFRLCGALNIDALERGFNTIIARHGTLRTVFIMLDGEPVQIVQPDLSLTLHPVIDLSELDPASRDVQLNKRIVSAAHQPFDLSEGPLIKAMLFRLAPTEHMLLLSLHHIVSDAWSTMVLVHELAALYGGFSRGETPELPALPIQYIDVARWQRQWFTSTDMTSQLAYWQQQLAGARYVLELPTDYRRPLAETFNGTHQPLIYSNVLTKRLQSLAQETGSTLFMVLLAAFSVLLNRYTRQTDLLVGTPIANRNRTESEALIGCFINTLVQRIRIEGDPSFYALLRSVREVTLDAFDHQDLPFEKLVEVLQPTRDLSRNPLFQVLFSVNNVSSQTLHLPGLDISRFNIDYKMAVVDLSMSLQETPDGLRGVLEYNTDLFSPATILRLVGHYEMLLTSIVANPAQPISTLPMLTATDEHTMLVEWNATVREYPSMCCIHDLFQNQAGRTPNAEAVVENMTSLTYAQLDQRANQLAHYLQQIGVGPEVCVGICIPRSLHMTVGVLGILKAGACCVPLDPSFPRERLNFMLQDAQIKILLTQQDLSLDLATDNLQCVLLDNGNTLLFEQPVTQPASLTVPDNSAFVLYGSSRTGRPQGVVSTHRSVVNLASAIGASYALTPQDRVLQAMSLIIDGAVEGIFATWCCGATLVLCPEYALASSDAFLLLIQKQCISVITMLTSFWHDWIADLAYMDTAIPASLKTIIVRGEQPLSEQLAIWQSLVSGPVNWHHSYGLTETTGTSTSYQYDMCQPVLTTMILPIGRPIANTRAYVLDDQLRPVPIGMPGELCIGGAGLARGYLNCPALTAERFIPDPFGFPAGQRLFKTGDLVRYQADGNLIFLGRVDRQIKIRGYRIEPEEIEAVLRQDDHVEDVVVLAHEAELGEKQLVAYFTPRPGRTINTIAVQNFLREHLPLYMIPSVCMVLETLPRSPRGDINYWALPEPYDAQVQFETTYTPPRTQIEEQLARIWADVLRVERVGIYDNFFDLGGDSLLSLQIIACARQARIDLTPRQVFRHQTIAELGAMLSTPQVARADQSTVTGIVPLTPIQHWFFKHRTQPSLHSTLDVLLDVSQPLEIDLLSQATQHLLSQHDILRGRFIHTAAGWQQTIIASETHVLCSQIDLAAVPIQEQSAAITAAVDRVQHSLDLAEGPLIRLTLFELGQLQPPKLLMVVHHLVADWVSVHTILEDLETAYLQLYQGQSVRLPPKTTSFKIWSERLMTYAESAELQAEQPYWLHMEQQVLPTLPVDYPDGHQAEQTTDTIWVSLNEEVTNALLHKIPSVYHTQINDVLLTALAQTLKNWTGSHTVYLDLVSHGRQDLFEEVDTSRTVGWFTSHFPVLLDLNTSSNHPDALQSIKEQLRSIPQNGIGYGVLRYLAVEPLATPLGTQPPAQITFNYLGRFDQALSTKSLFQLADAFTGSDNDSGSMGHYLLQISVQIRNQRLHVRWVYAKQLYDRVTIERVAHMFMVELQTLVESCHSYGVARSVGSE